MKHSQTLIKNTLDFIFFFFLIKKRNKKNQSAAADKIKELAASRKIL